MQCSLGLKQIVLESPWVAKSYMKSRRGLPAHFDILPCSSHWGVGCNGLIKSNLFLVLYSWFLRCVRVTGRNVQLVGSIPQRFGEVCPMLGFHHPRTLLTGKQKIVIQFFGNGWPQACTWNSQVTSSRIHTKLQTAPLSMGSCELGTSQGGGKAQR